MFYVITDSYPKGKTMLVKAESEEEVVERLNLSETQSISACFAGTEMDALEHGSFTVVTV